MANSEQAGVSGSWQPAMSGVAEALARNAQPDGNDPGDLGAALCIIVDGAVVFDGWHGWADRAKTQPWQRYTLVNAYSTMKPVAAVLALQLVAEGLLDLDEPLVRIWPEFAASGKGDVTLRHVLTHQAGLPGARAVLADDALYDWHQMTTALAESEPWWPPGTAHGYHVNTFGFLAGEPVRRLRSMPYSDALRTFVAEPHGLDMWVGVPDAEHPRIAEVETGLDSPGLDPRDLWPGPDEQATLLRHTYVNPRGASGIGVVNTAEWRRAMVPSTNGHATARGLAGFYAALLAGQLLPADLLSEATSIQADGDDRVLGRPLRLGLGFTLHSDTRSVGLTPSAYGHFGYGGSLGFADPTTGVAFAYLINRPGDRWLNPRTRRIIDTLASAL